MDNPAYLVPGQAQAPPAPQRARGEVRAEFASSGKRTALARLYQTGGLRLAIPNAAGACEGVIVNTGGGMAGGDQARLEFALGAGSKVMLTTQSAEKIYRGDDGAAEVSARVSFGAAARLEWLPQETILFEGARLTRRLEIDLAPDASLLLVEAFTFGRTAFGEDRIDASLRDSWRVRRAGGENRCSRNLPHSNGRSGSRLTRRMCPCWTRTILRAFRRRTGRRCVSGCIRRRSDLSCAAMRLRSGSHC